MTSRFTFLFATLLMMLPLRAETGGWQKEYGGLLKKYVSGGGVRYAAWKADAAGMAAMARIVAAIGEEDPSALPKKERLAYHINAYNALIIDLMLKKYPSGGVREGSQETDIFSAENIRLAGKMVSLNFIEKELVLRGSGDPRAPFALNCASKSCPVLMPGAYDGATIDTVLDERVRAYAASPLGVQDGNDGKSASLSMIFLWNADAFEPFGGVLGFLNKYRAKPLPKGTALEYQPYDWGLNEAK